MILSVINQKGGVGKTTTAVNLAVGLAQWGHRTLLVDLDPQGNATSGIGLQQIPSPSLYEALLASVQEDPAPELLPFDDLGGELPANLAVGRGSPLNSAPGEGTRPGADEATSGPNSADGASGITEGLLLPTAAPGCVPGLFVVGTGPELAGCEIELAGSPRRDGLRRLLRAMSGDYAFIVVDTPPSLSLLTVNSLVAADQLLIPVQCEYFALEGLGQLLRTLEKVKRFLNPELRIMGLLRTMFDPRVSLSGQVSNELELHFPQLLFKTVIPRNVRLAEAPSFGKPIALHDRRSPGADAYRRLAREVLDRTGLAPGLLAPPAAASGLDPSS